MYGKLKNLIQSSIIMHSLAPYTIRTFDQQFFKLHNMYPPLNKVLGRYDLYEIFKKILTQQGSNFHIDESDKKIFRILDLHVDDKTRIIHGYLEQGYYGLKSEIVNIETGGIDYNKTEKNAELIKYFFYLKVPCGFNEGVALFQIYKNNSAKTLISDLLSNNYRTSTGLNLQFNTLTDLKSFEKWKNGKVNEIKLTKFNEIDDKAQRISKLGHSEVNAVLSIKPKTKNGCFGFLRDYFNSNSDQFKAIEVWEEGCGQVRTVVALGGKNRTFTVGRRKTTALCEIEAPDDIVTKGGLPTYAALKEWFHEVDEGLSVDLYKT